MSSQHFVLALIEHFQDHSLVVVAASFATALFLWRVIKFSVIPAFYPNEPEEFPYLLPCRAFLPFSTFSDASGAGRGGAKPASVKLRLTP